jgi:hypothetical protein
MVKLIMAVWYGPVTAPDVRIEGLLATPIRPYSVPAGVLPIRHAFEEAEKALLPAAHPIFRT